jgi:hypothetical protein
VTALVVVVFGGEDAGLEELGAAGAGALVVGLAALLVGAA